ncbi:hypothetical protein KUL25_20125 [Rhodobacteraceae bacterium N5(2021)]|uniref:Lipoprotein n=1 Tax=Gymnodinialimonas phycosphaerae TaxID=2841589 RepID=A0A975YFT2_9RHOB|nr:hypothetical protein [Gymnodinialimonas phycosphaerae]MBY4895074.1 hypothetical protein [Gymnodinialimonas phycosphaerae]
MLRPFLLVSCLALTGCLPVFAGTEIITRNGVEYSATRWDSQTGGGSFWRIRLGRTSYICDRYDDGEAGCNALIDQFVAGELAQPASSTDGDGGGNTGGYDGEGGGF